MAVISKEVEEIISSNFFVLRILPILGLTEHITEHYDLLLAVVGMFKCSPASIFSGITQEMYSRACARLREYNDSAVQCLKYTATDSENAALALVIAKPGLHMRMRNTRLRNIITGVTRYQHVLHNMRSEAEQQIQVLCDEITPEQICVVKKYLSGGLFMFYMYYIPVQCKNWKALTILLLMTNPAEYTYAKLSDLLRQVLYMRYTPMVCPYDTTEECYHVVDMLILALNRYEGIVDATRPLYVIPFAHGDCDMAATVYDNITIKRAYPSDRLFTLCCENMTNITPELRALANRINNE